MSHATLTSYPKLTDAQRFEVMTLDLATRGFRVKDPEKAMAEFGRHDGVIEIVQNS